MSTFTIIAIIAIATVLLIVLAAYISLLRDDRKYYKMLAERWEDAFDSMAQNPEADGAGSMAYLAELNKACNEVTNGTVKPL